MTIAIGGTGSFTPAAAMAIAAWAGGFWSTSALAGPQTLTPAQFCSSGETFLTLTNAAPGTVTTPKAGDIVAQIQQALGYVPPVGFTFQFEISDQGAGTATLAAGTGVTISGTATVTTGTNRTWLCTITSITPGQEKVTVQNIASRSN